MPVYTLAAPVRSELDIRKSRFLAVVLPVADRDEASRVIASLRADHSTATHVCWALMAGGHSGMSDDGEPSGTAGRPMLEVLRHHELEGVLAAVVRYYGGIRLGAGGLVRAYTDAVASALKQAQRIERIAQAELLVVSGYADEARLRRWIESEGFVLVECLHDDAVRLRVILPHAALGAATAAIGDMTQGRAQMHLVEKSQG